MNNTAIRAFRKLCLATLIAVYFLILVGGIVRTTGSGMGCPDWPRCFGQWIPPTSVNELPADYKEAYSSLRDKKNKKFISFLRALGMNTTANALLNDKSILVESSFNAVKTWIEYLNRLIGVVIGLFIVALFWRSWGLRKSQPKIFIFSGITLLAVIVQGWFGSIVVSTNLTSWTISIHMLMALLIVASLVYLHTLSEARQVVSPSSGFTKWTLVACMILLLTQILFGTEVRSAIDRVAQTGVDRIYWIDQLGGTFLLHRSFSWAVLLAHVILVFQLQKTKENKASSRALIILILSTLLTGAGMAYFSVPTFLQPIHLLLATITFGMQLLFLLRMNTRHSVTV